MGGIGDVVAGLHAAISEGNDAIQRLRLAHEALDDSARGLYDVAYGTNDQDLAMVHDQLTTAVDDIELLITSLTAERGRVGDLIAHYSGDLDQGDIKPRHRRRSGHHMAISTHRKLTGPSTAYPHTRPCTAIRLFAV